MDPSSSETQTRQVQANWAWIPNWVDAPKAGEAARLVTFRRAFDLPNKPDSPCYLRLSADTRYKLTVNGVRVSVGPSRGSDRLWYYDTIDIASHLRKGNNDLTIIVCRWFPNQPCGTPFARTSMPGLSVLGQAGEHNLSTGRTDQSWEGREEGVFFHSQNEWDIFLHVYEDVRHNQPPGPWMKLERHKLIDHYGIQHPWHLAPRMIPLPEQTKAPIKSVRHAVSHAPVEEWEGLFRGRQLTLAPGSHHRIELEYAVHSTAFLRFISKRSKHPGTSVRITYSECYEAKRGTGKSGPQAKGDRTKRDGQVIQGPSDYYEFGAGWQNGEVDIYEPFWWRTFRFLLLEFTVGDDPLELLEIEATQTNYPMNVTAEWEVNENPEYAKMWEVSLRTMRNCMFDGYSDCPFYEQLQYCEDTRSAIMFHYMVSGDDRLARQAITAYAASVLPDGLVCGRYPAHGTQIITGFALFWVLQVCDHMLHFNDPDFAKRFLHTIDGVLGFFENKIDRSTGLVTGLPRKYWSFVDWHNDWKDDADFVDPGVPQAGRKDGTWSYFSMLYIHTLRQSANLLDHVNRPSLASEYRERADRTSCNVQKHCFDGSFYLDGVQGSQSNPKYSQHAQIWAIISGIVPADRCSSEGARLMGHAFSDPSKFAICSYPMQHYAFRALALAGIYNEYFHQMWEPWRKMLANNLTTWEEDSVTARSDCHEWSSLPLWEYTAEVAGLTPIEPGWKVVRFTPRVGLIKQLRAKLNLGPLGLATVTWETSEEGKVKLELRLPQKLQVISEIIGQRMDQGCIDYLSWHGHM